MNWEEYELSAFGRNELEEIWNYALIATTNVKEYCIKRLWPSRIGKNIKLRSIANDVLEEIFSQVPMPIMNGKG
jgi:predicted ATP-dependent Lon-type protease